MYPKTMTLIATIFLLSFKNISSMDRQAQPSDAQSVSRFSTSPDPVKTHVPFIPGLALNQLMEAHVDTRNTIELHECNGRIQLLQSVSTTLKKQRQTTTHQDPNQSALQDIEKRWHLTNHKTPLTTPLKDMRVLAYKYEIERLSTPSIRPTDPLRNVDPSQIARLRQLVRTYSMYNHQRVDAQKKGSSEYQQEVTSLLDETYGDILDAIRELPAGTLPHDYDQEIMIPNIREILKRHALFQRCMRKQELKETLSVAIAATSHPAAARESSVNSVNT